MSRIELTGPATRTILPTGSLRSTRHGRLWTAVAATVAAVVLAACGGSTRTSSAPTISVVTGLWPLAAAASEIGQGNVAVDDIVPPGDDPRTWSPGPSARSRLAHAVVILEVGGGFQPAFESAAGSSRQVVRLRPPSGSPYVWLDPATMRRTAAAVATALEAADPPAAATFRSGLANLDAELGSLDADYQSTLSACPDRTLVTVDDAFSGLHPRYPVVDLPIAVGPLTPVPSAADIARQVAAIRASGAKTIYTESFIPESDILAASARAQVDVRTLDTLVGPPTSSPWPFASGTRYVSLMEINLSTISSALRCPNAANN